MKKPFVFTEICLVVICFFISIYISNKHDDNRKMKALNLKSDEIQRINISVFPLWFEEFDITDEEKINRVINYLNSLNTIETKENPSEYAGGAYSIKIYLKNGSTRGIIHSGNKFLMEVNRFTYEIPYEEAIKFGTIIANILENNENKTNESSITGIVVSVNTEASGRDESCIIKDKDNKAYNINVEQAKIIDATKNGWLILHVNDTVRVFYHKEIQSSNVDIKAVTVYIKVPAK